MSLAKDSVKPDKSSKRSLSGQEILNRARRLCSVGGKGGLGGRDEGEEVGGTTSPVRDLLESLLRLSLVILKRLRQRRDHAPQAI